MTEFEQRVPVSPVSPVSPVGPAGLDAGEGEAIWSLGGLLTLKASAATTAGQFEVIEGLIAPNVSPPWHVHHRQDESFYLLAGRVTYYIGDQIVRAEPGAFVFLPRGIPHTFRIEGPDPARTLEVTAPSGLWSFFTEMGEPARERTLPPAQRPDIAKLRGVAAHYGIDILGPLNG